MYSDFHKKTVLPPLPQMVTTNGRDLFESRHEWLFVVKSAKLFAASYFLRKTNTRNIWEFTIHWEWIYFYHWIKLVLALFRVRCDCFVSCQRWQDLFVCFACLFRFTIALCSVIGVGWGRGLDGGRGWTEGDGLCSPPAENLENNNNSNYSNWQITTVIIKRKTTTFNERKILIVFNQPGRKMNGKNGQFPRLNVHHEYVSV